MATQTYKTSDWATVRVTTNADWSRSATVVNSGNSGVASWTTYSRWSSWWITVSNGSSSQSFNNSNDAINYWRTLSNNNSNNNSTPTINLWEYWKFGADAYNTPNFDINTRNNMIIQWLWKSATDEAAVRNYLRSNQSFANASAADQQNTINNILRQAATVATAQNPVVDVNPKAWEIVYDANNPQDYLDRLQARTALTGQQLTQDEYYNMLQAQRAIQQQQYKNPYEDYMKQLQQQIQEAQLRERQRDEQALQAYQSRLDSQYSGLIDQQRQGWEASKTAAQNVYSFSGFGRSSAAANKQAEIQDSTNRAIQALNQQKLAEIELKRAELEWADGDELTYLKNQMNTLQQATTQYQLEALSKMAEANAQAWNDAVTNITNMLAAAANSWIDITWDGYERIITAFNWMTPEQQDAYLSTLNPTDQLLVLWWAANSADGSYKFISWSKYQKAWYFNEKTWEFFPLSWGGSYGWGGGWSWNWGGGWWNGQWWSWWAEVMQNSTTRALNALYNLPRASRLKIKEAENVATLNSVLWNANSYYDYLRDNLTLSNFLNMKKNWATFGSMSNAEWEIVWNAATNLKREQWDEAWKATIKEIANNMWITLNPTTYKSSILWWIKEVSPSTSTTTNTNTNTNTSTNNWWKSSAEDRAAELLW